MPEKGWKTLQVKEEHAERLVSVYEKKKHELLDMGIRSFNSYLQHFVEK